MSLELTPHIEALIYASFHGELSAEQMEELSAWVSVSRDHARYYYTYSLDERSIDRVLRGEQLGAVVSQEASLDKDAEVELQYVDPPDGVWAQLVEDALAERRRHEVEDEAQRRLEADQAKASRKQMYERRRLEMERAADSPHVMVVPKWPIVLAAAVLGLAAILSVTGVLSLNKQPSGGSPSTGPIVRDQPQMPAGVVGVVRAAIDARWEAGAAPVTGQFRPGTYRLEVGLVQLAYGEQASLVIEGPAQFEVRDAGHLEFVYGGLHAETLGQADQALTVTTPQVRIVNQGSAFGVFAEVGGLTEAHAYQGWLLVESFADGQPTGASVRLSSGEAARMSGTGGRLRVADADALAVVRHEEFAVRERAAEGPGYDRWLAWSYEVRRDSTVFAYYPFDNRIENDERLINRASTTRGTLDGRFGNPEPFPFSEPQWADGRWPGKDALHFRSSERDHILIPRREARAFDDLDAVTIACWVRVEDPAEVHHLVTKRDINADSLNFAWVGAPDAAGVGGQRAYSILGNFRRPGAGQNWADFESPSVLRNRSGWAMLAVSYDGQRVQFYLDGEQVGSYRDAAGIQGTDADLLIGGAAVHLEHWAFLDGEMDELVIWSRVLDGAEISAMYEAGKP